MHAWEAVITWNRETKEVLVSHVSEKNAWRLRERYPSDVGATWGDRAAARGAKAVAFVFIDFHTLVVRDGMPIDAVHREFLKIDEYRRHMSPDISGGEDFS